MGIKDIVDDYFRSLENEAREQSRTAVTVRVSQDVKERLERIAKDMDRSLNSVAADLLEHASMDLAAELASRYTDDKGMYFWLAYGATEQKEGE